MNLNQKLEFKEARLEDLPEMVVLVESVYRGDNSKKGWTTEADILDGSRTDLKMLQDIYNTPNNLLLTARSNQKLVASVHIEHVKNQYGYLGMFAIDVSLQGQQFGRRFLEYAENYMKSKWGVDEIRISVIHLRTELIAWYERRGYKLTGRSEMFPTDPRYGIPKVPHLELLEMKKTLQ